MIKIGLPKGRFLEVSHSIINNLVGEDYDKNCSYYENKDKDVEIYLLKSKDIANLVSNGYLDIGLTNEEWILEFEANVDTIKTTELCNTKICFLKSKNNIINNICFTEFPNITRKYFKKSNIDIDIVVTNGGVEGLANGNSCFCVDCVESGNTLNKENLEIIDDVLTSKMVYIVNKNNAKDFFELNLE